MQQPKPIARKYDDIVRSIENGTYQIPKFQRDFVWKKESSAKLIDSLLKGFPIGSFILWKTKERLNSLKKLGGEVLKDTKEGDFVYYILDGQQRITSLYLCLKGITIEKDNYKEIYIDLDKEIDNNDEICVVEQPQNSISFYDLMNEKSSVLMKKFGENTFEEKLEKLQEHIKTYEFSTIEIENQPLEKIVDIFTRINTGGKELTLFEIMNAKVYTESKNGQESFDLEEKFNALIEELRRSGYESIAENKSLILQLIALILKKNAKREAILSIEKNSFIKEWDNATECLKLAIDKIRDSLKIPVSKLLPYYALIIPYAYFYHINNKHQPTKLQLENLHKYFFRSAFGERFSSSTESKLNEDIKLIEKIQKNEQIDFKKEIDCDDTKDYYKEELQYSFSTSSAFDKAVLCILAYAEPKSFGSNSKVRLDNSWLNIASSKNYHHFFPKAFLKRQKRYSEETINALANITLVDDYLNKRRIGDKSPKTYIKEFQKENSELEETLKSHLIDLKSFGILDNDYDTFLEKRADLLAHEILKRI
ncbi:DUF262 domain-containing protein [Helicobacter sp. UBA3407]|uniref:GmrSD restriction endonuclease domain-containing protein n=1 Tax=Helicobacter TaxID=209 RepID=UPI00261DC917|nr:DUF262 domain-containing protein [Helicobacter sp. UBA3407]